MIPSVALSHDCSWTRVLKIRLAGLMMNCIYEKEEKSPAARHQISVSSLEGRSCEKFLVDLEQRCTGEVEVK